MRLVRSPDASAPSMVTSSFSTVAVVSHSEFTEFDRLSMKPFLPSTEMRLLKSPLTAAVTISETSASIAFSAVSSFQSMRKPSRVPFVAAGQLFEHSAMLRRVCVENVDAGAEQLAGVELRQPLAQVGLRLMRHRHHRLVHVGDVVVL